MRERGRDNFLLPRECCFSSFFVYSCCNELLLELSQKRDFSSGSFCRFATVSGLCNSSAFSSAFVPFAPSNFLISSEQQRKTHILYYYYITEKGEKEREREKGEKLFAAFPSHRRKTSSTKQKRDREIERITQNTEEENCVLYPIRREFLKRKDDPSVLFAVQI